MILQEFFNARRYYLISIIIYRISESSIALVIHLYKEQRMFTLLKLLVEESITPAHLVTKDLNHLAGKISVLILLDE